METLKLVSVPTVWTENSSVSLPPTEPPEWGLVRAIIPPYIFTLCVFGLLGNGFVLLVFSIHKERLTVPEIYLGNLALADFILLAGLPFWAMYIRNHFNWPYGDALCKIVNSCIVFNFYTSIYTLTMISIDRYLALVKTMEARWLRRTLHAKIVCFILLLVGLFMSLPTMLHRKVMFIESLGTLSCILDYDDSWKLAHETMLNVVGFILPLLVIVFCSCNVIRALRKRKETVRFNESNDTKATALMYTVTLVFFLCWGPFQVFTFLEILCHVQAIDEMLWFHTLDIGHQVSVYLAFLNSTLNPVLYVFSGQYFRRKVSTIYRRTRGRRRGSDMTTYQRSVVSTYINRAEQIKPVVLPN